MRSKSYDRRSHVSRCSNTTFGNDPGPSDGEPVVADAHGLDQLHIVLVLVVAVASNLAVRIVVNVPQLGIGEGVPDAHGLAVLVPATLNLGKEFAV